MLKNCFSLTKVLIKSLFDSGEVKAKKNKRKPSSWRQYLIIGLVLLITLGVPLFFMGYGLGYVIMETDPTIQNSLWQIILPISSILLLLMSIFSIISVFFFSMDNSILLPLPLKGWEILVARFITSLLLIYSIELMFVTPLIYGLATGFTLNVLQFVFLTIIQLCLPIFPVVLCGIIFTFLSRVINFAKYKNAFTYVSIIFSIGLGVGISSLSMSLPSEETEMFATLIEAIKETGNSVIPFFPHLIPAINSLTNPNLLLQIIFILLFIIISIAMIALFLILCQKPYYKTLKESDGVHTKRKKISKKEISDSSSSSKGVFGALVSSEWKSIVRSPALFTNTILVVIIVPIIFICSFGFGFNGTEQEGESLNEIIASIQNASIGNSITLLIILAIVLFFSAMNMTSSTAISRMGKSSHFVRYIPVKPSIILHSKLFIGFMLSNILTLLIVSAVCVLGIINIFEGILLLILCISLNLLDNYIALSLDLKKPQLNWDNEIKAVKNNFNAVWSMLISFALIIIAVIICVIAATYEGGGYVCYVLFLVGSLFGNYLFYKHFNKPSHILFEKL